MGAPVKIDCTANPGFIVQDGRDLRLQPIDNPWDAPSAAVVRVGQNPAAALVTIIAWLAYPDDDCKRRAAADAGAARLSYGWWRDGRIISEQIPERLRAERLPRRDRERRADDAERRAYLRMRQASLIVPLLLARSCRGIDARYSIEDTQLLLDPSRDRENARRRRWKPLAPVAHLALAFKNISALYTEPPEEFLIQAEAIRRVLPSSRTALLAIEKTIQFRATGKPSISDG